MKSEKDIKELLNRLKSQQIACRHIGFPRFEGELNGLVEGLEWVLN